MTYENFLDYTEEDPNNHIAYTAYHIDSTVKRNEDAYLYDDKGVDHFTDFTHTIDVKGQDPYASAWCAFWVLSNGVDDITGLRNADITHIALNFYEMLAGQDRQIHLSEQHSGFLGTLYSVSLTPNTWYYLKIVKLGTSLKIGIYSTSALRDVGDGTDGDIDNLSWTLQANHNFRYVFAVNTHNDGKTFASDIDIENLDLQEVVAKPSGSIVPLMCGMDMISAVKPWKKRFPKLAPRTV